MNKSIRENSAFAVRTLLSTLPKDVVKVRESYDEYEHRIEVTPASERHCWFWMGFSNYETYGLGIGHGLSFEDLPISEFPPDIVAQAIVNGCVQETIWLKKNRVVRAEGVLTLPDGRVLSDNAILRPLATIGSSQKKEIKYSPYTEIEMKKE